MSQGLRFILEGSGHRAWNYNVGFEEVCSGKSVVKGQGLERKCCGERE
jgi:hypothetical protein